MQPHSSALWQTSVRNLDSEVRLLTDGSVASPTLITHCAFCSFSGLCFSSKTMVGCGDGGGGGGGGGGSHTMNILKKKTLNLNNLERPEKAQDP